MTVRNVSCVFAEANSSGSTPMVRLINQTVKDFFVDKGLRTLGAKLLDPVCSGHSYLLRTCFQYFKLVMHSLKTPFSAKGIPKFALIRYATGSWVYHLRKADTDETAASISNWSMAPLIELWLQAYRTINSSAIDCPPLGAKFTHIISGYGFSELLSRLPEFNIHAMTDMDSKDEDERTPLAWAAENGHEAVVEVHLRNEDEDVDCRDKGGRTPLAWATENGHIAVVDMLLGTGKVHK
ncbi:hypothetical protein ACHAPJ_010681 [Fusarium lateritium]